VAGAAQRAHQEGVAVVGDHQVERAVSLGVEIGECLGGGGRIGMVECLQHEFAARAGTGGRAQGAVTVEDRRHHAGRVDAEPRAAGEIVAAGHDLRAVGPMPSRGRPRTVEHFIAIGGNNEGPGIVGAPEYDEGAHRRRCLTGER